MDENSNSPGNLLPATSDFNMDPPDTAPDDTDERRKKTISKSKQWKDFVAFARQRQKLFQAQTPGGIKYNNMPKVDAAFYSSVGNAVIEEYEMLINYIEGVAGA